MGVFEMYEKEFTVKIDGKDETFVFKPLGGRYLSKFYKLISRIESSNVTSVDTKATNQQIMSLLGDEDFVNTLYLLTCETLKKSYPDKYTEDVLDLIVSRNLMSFLGPILEVNSPQG